MTINIYNNAFGFLASRVFYGYREVWRKEGKYNDLRNLTYCTLWEKYSKHRAVLIN